ncbi:hypothetical protein F2Q69_00020931 [Brassica cretica]|uniref:Uncharacterized protein n=1 Tax=Brassica cretica TaxID=69181 RepID=A0A8S9QJD3_BRACR|nr:hypothetical protein F2Q69_00020931 [Brassica cretica]
MFTTASWGLMLCDIVEECIENNMSKDETVRHLWDKYLIPHEYTNIVPQEAAAYANVLENQSLQASQQPAYPNDFWQRFMNTLGQIQSNTQHLDTLGHIQSNTEQVVKLLTDGHVFGPHPLAAGSSKRQRAAEAEERCNSEAATKLQENEEGDEEEPEKLHEKERPQ